MTSLLPLDDMCFATKSVSVCRSHFLRADSLCQHADENNISLFIGLIFSPYQNSDHEEVFLLKMRLAGICKCCSSLAQI